MLRIPVLLVVVTMAALTLLSCAAPLRQQQTVGEYWKNHRKPLRPKPEFRIVLMGADARSVMLANGDIYALRDSVTRDSLGAEKSFMSFWQLVGRKPVDSKIAFMLDPEHLIDVSGTTLVFHYGFWLGGPPPRYE